MQYTCAIVLVDVVCIETIDRIVDGNGRNMKFGLMNVPVT